uniref:Manganese lipoxygenase n=1 Tax=Pleurotus ostreatus TaxID=5322 RepID=D4Q9Z3_PLEOS|nr:lipoxygenase [Pleurotus ostreatus]BAL46153.1 lipoxygenase [Pleurotus ostreatus]
MAPTMSLSRSALKNVHLPYMVQHPEPTDCSTAMKHAAEGYDRARQMIAFLFDILDYESSVPQKFTPEEKKEKYTWSHSDKFPPHLAIIPEDIDVPAYIIFSIVRLVQTLSIMSGIQCNERLAPGPEQNTMEKLTKWNAERHKNQGWVKDMFNEPNIGLRNDWYTDAVFAQQFFTGPNPTTITLASDTWMKAFTEEAASQGKRDLISLFRSAPPNSFYVQDFSDFRARMGAKPDEELCATSDGGVTRYGCAAVALFYLPPTGELHPLAIVPDYKGSMAASITLFNKRVDPSDASVDQANDWPWRYAKTCVLSADWVLHEMIIHLNNTHLVQEAVIVAVQRTLPDSHIVFRLLKPHWVVTLSLNAQARSVLIPEVIVPIAGFSELRIFQFVGHAFTNFDWKALYVPTDLEFRGFPLDRLDDDKFHNYAYAKDIKDMWMALRKFVSSVLKDGKYYPDDSAVAADAQIQDWCDEMRSEKGAGMKKFPESISTLDDLIDMVTMCIHIAAPQHTAVNYLQQYYQTFVPNKPSALFSPLPTLLSQLESYTESDLMAALPLGAKQEWLLMAQVPYLLSKEVEQDGNIVTYAGTASNNEDPIIAAAGKELSADLVILAGVFLKNSEKLDDQNTAYNVLAPDQLANAIVI